MTQMAHGPQSRSSPRFLITGTSSGIGLAAAEQLARNGAEVIMVSPDDPSGAEARDRVAAIATGPPPRFLAADLSSQDSIRDLARRLHAVYDSIDVLINNAVLLPGTGS